VAEGAEFLRLGLWLRQLAASHRPMGREGGSAPSARLSERADVKEAGRIHPSIISDLTYIRSGIVCYNPPALPFLVNSEPTPPPGGVAIFVLYSPRASVARHFGASAPSTGALSFLEPVDSGEKIEETRNTEP
jgi:hypothetical protein